MKRTDLLDLINLIFGMFTGQQALMAGIGAEIQTGVLTESGDVLNLSHTINSKANLSPLNDVKRIKPLLDYVKTNHGRHHVSHIVAMNEFQRQRYISIIEHWDDVLSFLKAHHTSKENSTTFSSMEFAERFYSVDMRLIEGGKIISAPYESVVTTLQNDKTIKWNPIIANTYSEIFKLLGSNDTETITSTLSGYTRRAIIEINAFNQKLNSTLTLLCEDKAPDGNDWENDQRARSIKEALEQLREETVNIGNHVRAIEKSVQPAYNDPFLNIEGIERFGQIKLYTDTKYSNDLKIPNKKTRFYRLHLNNQRAILRNLLRFLAEEREDIFKRLKYSEISEILVDSNGESLDFRHYNRERNVVAKEKNITLSKPRQRKKHIKIYKDI